jgi:hypothetical protein
VTDREFLLDLADRIERVSKERITGDLGLEDADRVREFVNMHLKPDRWNERHDVSCESKTGAPFCTCGAEES